jgi:tetratricopeptide (TPR) repeat protein
LFLVKLLERGWPAFVIIPLLKRYGPVFVAGLLVVGAGTAPGQRSSSNSDADFARGLKLQQAGDLAGACRAYEAVLKLSPRRIDALSNLGLAYGGMHQYERAIHSFEKALEIDPKQPAVRFNLGLTYLQAGQNENSRETFGSLVREQAGNFQARHYLAISLLKLGRIQEGIAELETVAGAHPEDLEALYTLSSAYIRTGELEKARRLIDSGIINHNTAEAHLIAGSYYLAAKAYREAIDELREAQRLNAAIPEVASSLGSAYAITGSQEMATRLFEEYLKSNPSDFDTLAVLGWLYLEAERWNDAETALNKAHRIKPADPEVMFQLARLARAQQHFDQALALLERVVAAEPDHTGAHVLLAQTYFNLKRTADGNREREIVKRLNEAEQAKRLKETGIESTTDK